MSGEAYIFLKSTVWSFITRYNKKPCWSSNLTSDRIIHKQYLSTRIRILLLASISQLNFLKNFFQNLFHCSIFPNYVVSQYSANFREVSYTTYNVFVKYFSLYLSLSFSVCMKLMISFFLNNTIKKLGCFRKLTNSSATRLINCWASYHFP